VIRTRVGYCGGVDKSPTYHDLGDHTESIQIEFDSTKTTYEKLLEVFWTRHYPFGDKYRQYRSAIFYHNEEQKKLAEQTFQAFEKQHKEKPSTDIEPCGAFYLAEGYHQKYYLKHSAVMKALKFTTEDEMTHSPIATRLNGYVGGNGDPKQLEAELPGFGPLPDSDKQTLRDALKKNKPWSCA